MANCIALMCAIAISLVATAASAQPLVVPRPLHLDLVRVAVALLFCIGLALATAIILKRAAKGRAAGAAFSVPWGAKPDGRSVSVLETRRISQHADVCRLAYAGREYLVVVSQSGATLLREDAEPAA